MIINCTYICQSRINIDKRDEVIPPEVNRATLKFEHIPIGIFNDDIKHIVFENVKMEKIPKGFGEIFKYTRDLFINKTNLKSIAKEDLKQFPYLQKLTIMCNPLESLPGDLFEYNKHITQLNFHENKIKFIGAKLLDELPKLKHVEFIKNISIDISCSINHEAIKSLKEIFLRDCQPPKMTTKRQFRRVTPLRHLPKLNEDLENFLKNEEFKDFTIKVNNVDFKIHKFLFMARSATFAEMIKKNPDADELQMTDVSAEVFESIINFVYTDNPPKDSKNAREIYSAAGMLKIESLKEIAAEMLINEMKNEENLDFLMANFNLGTKFECQRLKLGAFEEIRKHFPDKKLKDDLLNKPENLKEVIEAKKKLDKLMEG